jgi:septum formation protein
MPARPLVLASASPARLRLLRDAGFDPLVVVSGADEGGVDGLDAESATAVLARRKAEASVARAPDGALVVGCDSVLELDGTVLGKPADALEAAARWRRMRGRCGTLVTGHCVVDRRSGGRAEAVASTLVRFGEVSDAEIAAYVATGEPLGVAGAFTIDGRAAVFVDGIDGDPGTVVGLSLPLLRRLLAQLGVDAVSLWS